MSCGCAEPCEPQPYRCSCERDCWVGDPASYVSCMEDCDAEGCDFPEYPGLPSRGYRCDTAPDTEQADCETVCTDAYSDATSACFNARESCDGGTPEQATACMIQYCQCLNSAQQTFETCKRDCDKDHDYPDSIACAETDVEESDGCCDVELSGCYLPCEQAFLDAAEPVELTYLACVRAKTAAHQVYWYYDEDLEIPDCTFGPSPNLLTCERTRTMAMAPLVRTHSICRATCERNEIRRENPTDRKYKECGGRYHLCRETCDAELDYAVAVAQYDAYPCIEACVTADLGEEDQFICLQPCYTAYRQAYATAAIAQGNCRLACCKQEHDYASNDHAKADCEYDCYEPRITGTVACYDAYQTCITEAIMANDGSEAQCLTDWCSCWASVTQAYDGCQSNCEEGHRGDCPDCFDDAISQIGGIGGNGYGSGIGMPMVGIGPDFEPQGCP